jgi:hypothetical protein
MFKIFKIKIPVDNAKEIAELESWTVSWTVATHVRWGSEKTFNKAFIKESEAREFAKQLKECLKITRN